MWNGGSGASGQITQPPMKKKTPVIASFGA